MLNILSAPLNCTLKTNKMANYNNTGTKSIFSKKTTGILLIGVPLAIVIIALLLKFA